MKTESKEPLKYRLARRRVWISDQRATYEYILQGWFEWLDSDPELQTRIIQKGEWRDLETVDVD
jgi:hypothetical protein